jgi:glutamyl-tRNA reductase
VKLVLFGMNHRTAPLDVREGLAVDDPTPALQKLARSEEVDEAVLLSTCNRIEIVVLTRDVDAARLRLRSFFRRELSGGASDVGETALDRALYEHRDGDAMRHVLRVASALDSMVVGEPQILGQTKDAYRSAVECGASGPILDRLYQRAFATAKRVRTETRIAERPVSVARVAVNLARQIFEDFSDKQALLVGAGEMIELALKSLQESGLRSVRVANRTAERAADLAVAHGASAHGLDELPRLLTESDVVLTSIAVDRPILTESLLRGALDSRRGRPIFVIDIGVPRNADPAIDALDEVYRYDIDDLVSVADENAEERRREQARAEAARPGGGDPQRGDRARPACTRPRRGWAGGRGRADQGNRQQGPSRAALEAARRGRARGGRGGPRDRAAAVRPRRAGADPRRAFATRRSR